MNLGLQFLIFGLQFSHFGFDPNRSFESDADNAPLFEFSVEEFAACGLEVKNLTRNLHENGIVGIMTGYEEKFHALGTPINRCEVVCKPFELPKEEKNTEEEDA